MESTLLPPDYIGEFVGRIPSPVDRNFSSDTVCDSTKDHQSKEAFLNHETSRAQTVASIACAPLSVTPPIPHQPPMETKANMDGTPTKPITTNNNDNVNQKTQKTRPCCPDLSDYALDAILGSGTYGVVRRATCLKTGRTVAIKQLMKTDEDKQGFPLTTMREIKALHELVHPNVVNLLDVCMVPPAPSNKMLGDIYMVFEYCVSDLGAVLTKTRPGGLSDAHIKSYMYQLLTGLAFIHSKGWVHRDLKPQNLLLTPDNVLKIADLGLAKFVPEDSRMTPSVVTLWYRAPELLLADMTARFELDVWSAGCIFAELYLGEALFNGKIEIDQLNQIYQLCGCPNASLWPSLASSPYYAKFKPTAMYTKQFRNKEGRLAKRLPSLALDLLEELLTLEPGRRITARDALKHPYFLEGDGVPPHHSLPFPTAKPLKAKPTPLPEPVSKAPQDAAVAAAVAGVKRSREADANTDAAAQPSQPPAAKQRSNVTATVSDIASAAKSQAAMRTVLGGAKQPPLKPIARAPSTAERTHAAVSPPTDEDTDNDDMFLDAPPLAKRR